MNLLKKYHPIPAILSGFFIGIVCLIPGSDLPESTFLNAIYFDKWVHFFMYFVWSFVWCYGGKQHYKKAVTVAVFTLFFGAAIEIFQDNYIEGRSAEWTDWIAGSAGSAAGLVFWKYRFSV